MELLIFHDLTGRAAVKAMLEGNVSGALRDIIEFSESAGVTDNGVREYIVSCLVEDQNILSRLASSGQRVGEDLKKAARADLEEIFDKLLSIPVTYVPSGNLHGYCDQYINSIRELVKLDSAETLLEGLIKHYETLGSGELSRYDAFKYDKGFRGIAAPDAVSFDSLIGLEYQKKIMTDNVSAFVRGKPYNNMLLFGDRGTGKSSSVKALLQMFKADGLRVVELEKQYIKDIPLINSQLAGRPHKYMLFLDDLSFVSSDPQYKEMKIAMEGQLQANPGNVMIIATSNRRHLIKETVADREDMHRNDNMQETLSLSERFGISLVFSSPDQKEYLKIVRAMLEEAGYAVDADIERQAIVWQMNYGARSGRCARQFVASYIAKAGEEA